MLNKREKVAVITQSYIDELRARAQLWADPMRRSHHRTRDFCEGRAESYRILADELQMKLDRGV